ncbi:unnamed protein product, partial [Prorocentrum cordatum]
EQEPRPPGAGRRRAARRGRSRGQATPGVEGQSQSRGRGPAGRRGAGPGAGLPARGLPAQARGQPGVRPAAPPGRRPWRAEAASPRAARSP